MAHYILLTIVNRCTCTSIHVRTNEHRCFIEISRFVQKLILLYKRTTVLMYIHAWKNNCVNNNSVYILISRCKILSSTLTSCRLGMRKFATYPLKMETDHTQLVPLLGTEYLDSLPTYYLCLPWFSFHTKKLALHNRNSIKSPNYIRPERQTF